MPLQAHQKNIKKKITDYRNITCWIKRIAHNTNDYKTIKMEEFITRMKQQVILWIETEIFQIQSNKLLRESKGTVGCIA